MALLSYTQLVLGDLWPTTVNDYLVHPLAAYFSRVISLTV